MFLKFILILTLSIFLCGNAWAQAEPLDDVVKHGAPEPLLKPLAPDDPKAVTLKQEAAGSLTRARSFIKTKGFSCAIVELNIWKNLSLRAGSFDEATYAELQTELYEKSMTHQDKWFNYYIKKGYYNDAQKCLQTWRLHALTINKFDAALFAQKLLDLESIKK